MILARGVTNGRAVLWLAIGLLAGFGFGCRTGPPMAPVDISGPGWRMQQGQAVWKPDRHRVELAGELLLATRTNGDFFVQFSKPPFSLATAAVREGLWQIEFGAGRYSGRGQGRPPARFVWFQLPAALAGTPLASGWSCEKSSPDTFRLRNGRTGETLEAAFFP